MTSRRRSPKPQNRNHEASLPPVLITGASRGIGAATAHVFSRAGHPVILAARDEVALESVAAAITDRGGIADILPADLSGCTGATRFAEKLLKKYPGISAAILNAGLAVEGPVTARDPGTLQAEFDVNYFAPVTLARSLIKHWQSGPRQSSGLARSIVAVSSLTATVPFPGHANYGASKAALNQMLRNLRMELATTIHPHHHDHHHDHQRNNTRSIHIGIVSPGYTETQMTKGLETSMPGSDPEFIAQAIWDCFERRTEEVIPGLDNKIISGIFRHLPAVADRIMQAGVHWFVPGDPGRRKS